jgi:hypothetical protein
MVMVMHRLLFHRAHHPVAQYVRILFDLFLLLPVRACFGVPNRGMFATDIVIMWGGGCRDIKPRAGSRGKYSRRKFRFMVNGVLNRYHLHGGRRESSKEGTPRMFVVEEGEQ